MIDGASSNVKDYGATGDGTTDDTVAIQAAIDSGNDVFFPNGTYSGKIVISSKTNMTVSFEENAEVILPTASGGTILDINSSSDINIVGGRFSSVDRINTPVDIFQSNHINITGSKSGFATKHSGTAMVYSNSAFNITSSSDVTLDKVEAYNIEGAGIHFAATRGSVNTGDCFDLKIINCIIRDNITGILGGGSSEPNEGDCYNILVDGNTIKDNNAAGSVSGGDGILFTGYTSQPGDSGSKFIVSNNTISGSGEHGVYLHGREIIVTNNLVHGNFSSGIKMGLVNLAVVDGNIMSDNGYAGGGGHIYIQSVYRNMTVSNNVIKLDSDNEVHGIRLAYSAPIVAGLPVTEDLIHRNMVISGNVVENIAAIVSPVTEGGINVEVNHTMSITGNTMTNCGMSLAPSGAVAGNYVIVDSNILKDGLMKASGGAYTAIISNNIMKDIQVDMTADDTGTRIVGNTILDMLVDAITIDGSGYMCDNDITSTATTGALIKWVGTQTRADNSPWTFSGNTVTTAGASLCNFGSADTGYTWIITDNRFWGGAGSTTKWIGADLIASSIITGNIVLGATEKLFKDDPFNICGCIIKNNMAVMPATFTNGGGCQPSVTTDNVINGSGIA